MTTASEIRVGNILRLNNKICKVMTQELKGTGKFSKTVHVKVKNLEDGHTQDRSFRTDEKVDSVELTHVKMQYSYRDGDQFVFMNMETYEQFLLPEKTVGKHEVFLTENMEIDVEFVDGKPVGVVFPKVAELKVTSAPPGVKSGTDSTYKEVELENGLMVLVPQFVKEGETIRLDVSNLSYLERVTKRSM